MSEFEDQFKFAFSIMFAAAVLVVAAVGAFVVWIF